MRTGDGARWPLAYTAEATRLIMRLQATLDDPVIREMFASDPGGYLAYIDVFADSPLPEDARDPVARFVIEALFVHNGWPLPWAT